MNMNLEHYRVFYFIAKCGSVSSAAKIMNNSQPNLTRTVKNLEEGLGCPLFYRTNKGMKLSPEGEKLYSRLSAAFEQIELAEKEIEHAKNMESGFVSVSATEVALRCYLLPILKEFHTKYPGIQLRIGNQLTLGAMEEVKSEKADFAVITLPENPDIVQKETTLSFAKIKSIREVAVGSSQFDELKEKQIDVTELVNYPLISLSDDTVTYKTYRDFFAEYGISFSPDITAATADQILPMVESGLGIGFVPTEFLKKTSDLIVIKTKQELPKRVLYLVTRKDNPIGLASSRMKKMIFMISEASRR